MGLFDELRGRDDPPAAPRAPAGDFASFLARYHRGPIDSGMYAAWSIEEDDKDLARSRTFALMRRAADAIAGYESIVVHEWLSMVGLADAGATRTMASLEGIFIGLVDRETDEPMMLSASLEKGVCLHFHDLLTPRAKREDVWTLFAEHCERTAADARANAISRTGRPV